jgi:predicted nuclease of predicted toxin-antitoxin system
MRLLADLHISPSTVSFLSSLGHDILRVTTALPPTADDAAIIAYAAQENRTIITQDLDFSAIIALTQSKAPSLISLRLSSSRFEYVNAVLL